MRAKDFLVESSDDNIIIKDFIDFAASKLNLDKLPRIKLLRNPETASQRRSFGGYAVGQHSIEITVGNRHIMDVLRTLAHEMVHYRQDLNDELNGDSGKDGSPQENEANAEAAVIMRQWGKENPELFKRAALLAEAWEKMKAKEFINEDWNKVNKHDKTDGLSRKAVNAYRREHPGSKLKTAVTTKPSKLKKGSAAAKRRSSFCARMSGMKKHRAGAKTKRDPNSPINKALRRWNCESIEEMRNLIEYAEQIIRQDREQLNEKWTQKYKSSINCSHPKGFSQKAHCAGKKKHNEDTTMEAVCPDCGMCETHGNNMMEVKQRLDAKCWKGKHKEGTKMKGGVRVNNCVPNEGVAEGLPQTLRKVVPGYAKREIDKKMDAEKFGKSDVDRDANFQRYKKIQDKIKEQGVAEGERTMSRAAKGNEKYGKDGMKALAKAGREGASEKTLDAIRDKHDKYDESAKHGLYYNVNKRKAAGTSRPASSPKAPTAQAWKDAAKTAKK